MNLYETIATPALTRVMHALDAEHGATRLVGGCVRDALLGKPLKDIDIATLHTPEKTKALLQKAGISSVDTGIAHGTVTAVLGNAHFEITTLRKDTACDGRHAQVEFTDQWQEDAARRDFTMNALYLSIDGTLHDYFNGITDAQRGTVQFVGDASARITEDYLRILRYFRFHSYYSSTHIPKDILMIFEAHKAGITRLSAERIAQEMRKLLAAPTPHTELTAMQQCSILPIIMPHASQQSINTLRNLFAKEQACMFAPHYATRLAWVMECSADHLRTLGLQWKLSNKESEHLQDLLAARALLSEKNWQEATRLHGADTTLQAALLCDFSLMPELCATIRSWPVPSFPLRGEDLLQQGIPAGPVMGELLKKAEAYWVEQQYAPNKQTLLAWVLEN